MAITGITLSSRLTSDTILLYKEGDPTRLDNYRLAMLANAIYELWTTCIVTLDTDNFEARKILSPDQEGFRADRSCSRAITHLNLFVEDAHSHKKDFVLFYLDFKGLFSSTDQRHLVRVLAFMGLPQEFIRLVSKLYGEASTELITPYGHAPAVYIRRWTLQGDPQSPLLFDVMIESLIRWLRASNM